MHCDGLMEYAYNGDYSIKHFFVKKLSSFLQNRIWLGLKHFVEVYYSDSVPTLSSTVYFNSGS